MIEFLCMQVKLSSLHRYQPVVYLVKLSPGDAEHSSREAQTEDLQDVLPQLDIFEHEFPETQFIAVTAYQNEMVCLSVYTCIKLIVQLCFVFIFFNR